MDYEDSSQKFTPINSVDTLAGNYDSSEIGLSLINRLREADYSTLQSIVVMGAQQISNDTRIGMEECQKICSLASKKLQELEIESAPAFLDLPGRYCSMVRLRTGSKVLDGLLGGGIEVGALTELFGRSGSGKTQLCHTISVTSQTSPNLQYPPKKTKEGRFSKVIYIDTEGTYRPERVTQIARARGLREDKVVRNIHVINCSTIFEQEIGVRQICNLLDEDKSISLVIVDSIITHFRSEYSGRSTLPERQQRLNNQLSKLSKIARTYKVAVIMTNQLQSNPTSFGNNEKSTGGNIMGHNSTHRIRLNKSDFGNIYATIVKSPYHASDAPDAKYIITKRGIDDLPGELGQTIHY